MIFGPPLTLDMGAARKDVSSQAERTLGQGPSWRPGELRTSDNSLYLSGLLFLKGLKRSLGQSW